MANRETTHATLESRAGVSAAERVGARPERQRARRVAVVLGLIIVLAGSGAALGASELFSVGEVVPGKDPSRLPELDVDETVLATGASPVAGTWVVTAYTSEASEGKPAGLPCIRLTLTNPPDGSPIHASGFCGEMTDGFGAASLPVKNLDTGQAEVLAYGRAPAQAEAVELTADGASVRAQSRPAPPSSVSGDVWVMSIPAGTSRRDAAVRWEDGVGRAGSKVIDPSGFFDRLDAVQRLR